MQAVRRRDHLTFRGNLRRTRHGWIRLTPAYSVHVVGEILEREQVRGRVLDPFCGTGTTALVCAERGLRADTVDINPFLVWLATAKTRAYGPGELEATRTEARRVARAIGSSERGEVWTPPLHRIEKWWDASTLRGLGRASAVIRRRSAKLPAPIVDLLRVALCRTLIGSANVSFGHQSMSFRKTPAAATDSTRERLTAAWRAAVDGVLEGASSPIAVAPTVTLCDARDLRTGLRSNRYECVITSPPYPNRMSYIRELRPYMFWLGYLSDGKAAGELDWRAIGGTWGSATSNVGKWTPTAGALVPFPGFERILAEIAERSPLLSRYVEKYFHDMVSHCQSLFAVVKSGGRVHYVVGNSKFYDVLLPVERIFAALFESVGFVNASIATLRKRTSKKELFEFVVSAEKP